MLSHHQNDSGYILVLLANYSPFLFILGLIFGLIIHGLRPIMLVDREVAVLVQVAGFLSLLIATGLFIWVHQIRKIFFVELTVTHLCAEIKRGPYKVSRHPGALSMVLLMLGLALIINSLALFLFTFILFSVFTWIIHPYQELLLVQECGEMYVEYKKKVRMWF